MLPNAIVVAFDTTVAFRPLAGGVRANGTRHGHLLIPLPEREGAPKPAWIVDGQQRAAAIRDARMGSFPVFVTGFVTDSVAEQREQFILVNSTKPLPKGLIYELLPATDMHLATQLERKRFPAYLLERLNYDSRSPLHLAIQTPTNPFIDFSARNRRGFGNAAESRSNGPGGTAAVMLGVKAVGCRATTRVKVQGFIKDNSILRMLENSLHDGALYRCRLERDGEMDTERMLQVLFNFWGAVVHVFDDAWELPPAKSRLTHGVGIISMGHVMDAIADRYRAKGIPSGEQFEADLKALKALCCWTNGHWDFGSGQVRKWNEVQNTTRDIQLVANYLLVQYKRLVWSTSA
jgi:hypothetical protein